MLSREQITSAIREAVEPLDYVNAMWLGGSDAFQNADEWSDVDVQLDAEGGRVDDAFEAVETALLKLSEFRLKHVLPKPTWHGHDQRFYRLKGASVHHFVDLVIMERDGGPRFNERELHGEPVVIFDKLGVIKSVANDKDKQREQIAAALSRHRDMATLTEGFVEKEVLRDNLLGAIYWHITFVNNALQQVVRMHHSPHRFTFSLRYADMDLPKEACDELRRLLQVDGLDDVLNKHRDAQKWFWKEAESLNIDSLEL